MVLQLFVPNNVKSSKEFDEVFASKMKGNSEYEGMTSEEIEQQKLLDRVLGKDTSSDENPLIIAIDEKEINDKYMELKPMYISVSDIKGVYVDDVNLIQEKKVMVVLANNTEYDCLFNQDIYDQIIAYLGMVEKLNIGSVILSLEQVQKAMGVNPSNLAGEMKNASDDSGKVIPMANFDANKN